MTMPGARLIPTATLLVALSFVPGAGAGPPTDQLREGVDRVVKILHDPVLAGERQATQRRAAIGQVAGEIFDFGEMAKRSLGQHWETRTPAERAAFARLFTDLIQRSYASQVDHYVAEKLVFRGDTIDGNQAVVRTAFLLNDGGQMALDYKMHHTSDRWRVYDIAIDGVSLVANYRAQFNKVIRSESYEALIARLKSNRVDSTAASPTRRQSSQ
jgi:phospholipid transport system substrate-binding protein